MQAFRDVRLFCEDDGTAPAAVFRTSGTTTSGARPGEHYMSAAGLARYEASLVPAFRGFVLPELSEGERRSSCRSCSGRRRRGAAFLALAHGRDLRPGRCSPQAPRYFLPASGLDWAGFQDALETGAAACVIATDLALDAWLSRRGIARVRGRAAEGFAA